MTAVRPFQDCAQHSNHGHTVAGYRAWQLLETTLLWPVNTGQRVSYIVHTH
jgi:hypothetical protein